MGGVVAYNDIDGLRVPDGSGNWGPVSQITQILSSTDIVVMYQTLSATGIIGIYSSDRLTGN